MCLLSVSPFERTSLLELGATIPRNALEICKEAPAALTKSQAHANAVASAAATADTPLEQLLADAAHLIDANVSKWDSPPRGFYWIPIVRFDVQREGDLIYRRLRRPLERLGLQVESPDAPRVRTISRSKTRSVP